jgi:uncharacterized protein YbbC (DUF1343 family)/CubicO group peptidase (beta-lactamase class C family)
MRWLLSGVVAVTFMAQSFASSGTPPFSQGPTLDTLIQGAISEGLLPGGVLVIGHNGRVVYEKAYGNRSLVPQVEPMTLDTIFDCASLTKVIATTSCLMKLYEEGKFRLNDPITDYIPEFQGGHSAITIRELMTHFSGLRPDVITSPKWSGYDHGIYLACTFPPQTVPSKEHIYSDINYELLGELVHRLSGKPLDQYAREDVFLPLGMKETGYNPPATLLSRIAPTEIDPETGQPLRGVVHDPTARFMGGVAGHAGMFSTAADLSRFAQMMLDEGKIGRFRFVSPQTIHKFTSPQTPPNQPVLRGLGWDIDSPFSSNRGELFPIGSFGHTGFTGTSIWIDPDSKSYVIFLANAVHPHLLPKSIVGLRAKIATVAATGLGLRSQKVSLTGYNELFLAPGFRRPLYRNAHTKTGLDVMEASGFQSLKGKRVGLITNQSGLDAQGQRNVDAMLRAGIKVVKLFSPEHGFLGAVDKENLEDTTDPATGLTVHSLYGKHLKPSQEMLQGCDVLVFDIQDAGVRFYTYETTLAYCLEAASEAKIPFVVLDRPNPLTGVRVEGPPMDAENTSFVGYLAGSPVRHGLTMGELATMFNAEKKLGVQLEVVKMEDWQRGDWFDSTGVSWINPSPNVRSLKAAILYPGICLVEFATNLSVGRGTDAPFEQVGADFINGPQLASYLNARELPGLRFYPTQFTPTTSNFAGHTINGIRIEVVDREAVNSCRLGIELACAIEHLYPGKIDWEKGKRLIGSNETIRQIKAGEDPYTILESWLDSLQAFGALRAKYLLYSQ